MNKKDFLICYDISNVKRLSKIGKIVEKRALRIQKSIYLFDNASKEELLELIEAIMKVFHELNAEGQTVLVVTHDEEIGGMTKRILRFRDGFLIDDSINESQVLPWEINHPKSKGE